MISVSKGKKVWTWMMTHHDFPDPDLLVMMVTSGRHLSSLCNAATADWTEKEEILISTWASLSRLESIIYSSIQLRFGGKSRTSLPPLCGIRIVELTLRSASTFLFHNLVVRSIHFSSFPLTTTCLFILCSSNPVMHEDRFFFQYIFFEPKKDSAFSLKVQKKREAKDLRVSACVLSRAQPLLPFFLYVC